MNTKQTYYFCGVGGSGMLPLAMITVGLGHNVYGSDRGFDKGITPEKFKYIQSKGVTLLPQDGAGVKAVMPDVLVVSSAVEDSIPDVKAAKEMGVPIQKRAALLADFFNTAEHRITVAGTSGKTTVTGMIGYILHVLNQNPMVMNGGVFKNFQKDDAYCCALSGDGGTFVSEADESDGSIALYHPQIALLNNIALDHKSMAELVTLFSSYLAQSECAVLNADHGGVMALKGFASGDVITYGLESADADVNAVDITLHPDSSVFTIQYGGKTYRASLKLAGRHNISNGLAALSACVAHGIDIGAAINALATFDGIWRRLDVVGNKNGVIVIDDFAHNPDKITASLKTLKAFDGRLKIFFQPHGFGFLKQLWQGLADVFAENMSADDELYLVQPYYAGGSADRTIDSSHVVDALMARGVNAYLCDDRDDVAARILNDAKSGDRIIVMGARDDSLHDFANEIYAALA